MPNSELELVRLLEALWAKTPNAAFEGQQHLPLMTHLEDACESVSQYYDHWLAPLVKNRIIEAMGGDASLARRLVRWLAAVHDFGKAMPSFQGQVNSEKARLEREAPELRFGSLGDANRRLPHSIGGSILLEAQLDRRGWNSETARSYTAIVAGHHGTYPSAREAIEARESPHLSGADDPEWSAIRDLVFERCLEASGLTDADLESLAERPLPLTLQLQLQALVVLADWCASATEDFPLSDPAHTDTFQRRDPRTSQERAKRAWERRSIPGPWRPSETELPPQDFYRLRFSWSDQRSARSVQIRALEIARSAREPGLMIVEAPMGSGKTELALAVAEELARRSGAGGVYFGLPTMATSDAMLERVIDWIGKLPDTGPMSTFLAHSKSALNASYGDLERTSQHRRRPLDAGEHTSAEPVLHLRDGGTRESYAVIADALSGRRLGVFANVVVGTVDQVLMAGLNSKHVALRHLGLSGKVVVIDEVHAADTYMREFLKRALEWLAAYGTPVILLSATLPPAQRDELSAAYVRGIEWRRRELLSSSVVGSDRPAKPVLSRTERRRLRMSMTGQVADAGHGAPDVCAQRGEDETSPGIDEDAYPVISWTDGAELHREAPGSEAARSIDVSVVRIDDDLETLVQELRERTRAGGCVLVVRNTVQRALEVYDRLLHDPVLGRDLMLAHSRFLAPDRAAKDALLRDRFGPLELKRERPGHPYPAIVVATQVAEQSLDVDFDLLVTDLAPADLVLQRIGRLHRHARTNRPARLSTPTCILTGVDSWQEHVLRPERGSRVVYGEHALFRSALAFERFGDVHVGGQPVAIPADIPRIVREAYAPDPPAVMNAELEEALERAAMKLAADTRRAVDRSAVWGIRNPRELVNLVGFSNATFVDKNDELARAVVRDGEDTFEVIVMRRGDDDATLRTLETLKQHADELVPTRWAAPEGTLARAVAASTVRLPGWLCSRSNGDAVIAALERNEVPSWQQHPLLRGQLVLVLDERLEAVLVGDRARFHLRYDSRRGLEIEILSDERCGE